MLMSGLATPAPNLKLGRECGELRITNFNTHDLNVAKINCNMTDL